MSFSIEELAFEQTPLGEISLRRRAEPRLDGEILYEVKLGDEFLMSSLFTEAEVQLAKLGLGATKGEALDIVVGGLGLGYTAAAALEDDRVRSMDVVEVMQPVIDWHQQGLVPLGNTLSNDSRCNYVHNSFFDLAIAADIGFDGNSPATRVHAILLDIDHSPSHWLNPQNAGFYSEPGLSAMARKLHPEGLFGLWSNDPPEQAFMDLLQKVFSRCESHIVSFPNPYKGGESTNTVYLATL